MKTEIEIIRTDINQSNSSGDRWDAQIGMDAQGDEHERRRILCDCSSARDNGAAQHDRVQPWGKWVPQGYSTSAGWVPKKATK